MSNFGHVTVDNFPATTEIANDSGNPIPVSGTVTANVTFPATQPVSASALPLPANAAQESGGNLAAILAKIIASPATEATLASILTKLNASIAVTGAFYQTTQPVSASSLPLPTGASTETTLAAILAKIIAAPSTAALQTTGNTSLNNIDIDLGAAGDSAVTNPASSASVIAALKGLLTLLTAGNVSLANIDTDFGAAADAQATNSTGSWNSIALLKGILSRPATGTTVSNTTLSTVTTVLAANTIRKGATFYSVTGTILLLLGSGATASLFTTRLTTNSYYEIPNGYTGIVTAIGAGTLLSTELT